MQIFNINLYLGEDIVVGNRAHTKPLLGLDFNRVDSNNHLLFRHKITKAVVCVNREEMRGHLNGC